MADHLMMYEEVDIALDTFPYNGTTTTCEALYMGVPIVTLAGNSHISRVGVSLLTTVGLSDLIADSEDEYIKKAIDLAHQPQRLVEFRETLRLRMEASALMDGQDFARRFGNGLIDIWNNKFPADSGRAM